MTGIVSAIIRRREGQTEGGGYGFIIDEQNQERFFHAHNLRNISYAKLREGMKVTFTPVELPPAGGKANGLRAEDVITV